MVLLDTCAAIWLANGEPMSAESLAAIRTATRQGEVLISPVSAWEVGLLAAKSGVAFRPSPQAWFSSLLALPGVIVAPLSSDAAIASSFLPGRPGGDPADRLLVATARELSASIVTRDRRILAYAAEGHVAAIRC